MSYVCVGLHLCVCVLLCKSEVVIIDCQFYKIDFIFIFIYSRKSVDEDHAAGMTCISFEGGGR